MNRTKLLLGVIILSLAGCTEPAPDPLDLPVTGRVLDERLDTLGKKMDDHRTREFKSFAVGFAPVVERKANAGTTAAVNATVPTAITNGFAGFKDELKTAITEDGGRTREDLKVVGEAVTRYGDAAAGSQMATMEKLTAQEAQLVKIQEEIAKQQSLISSSGAGATGSAGGTGNVELQSSGSGDFLEVKGFKPSATLLEIEGLLIRQEARRKQLQEERREHLKKVNENAERQRLIDALINKTSSTHGRLDALESRVDGLEKELPTVLARLDEMGSGIIGINARNEEFYRRLNELAAKYDAQIVHSPPETLPPASEVHHCQGRKVYL